MKRYYTRLWSNGKLVATVSAYTYKDALCRTAGNLWRDMTRHTHEPHRDAYGKKIPNYITFYIRGTKYFMHT